MSRSRRKRHELGIVVGSHVVEGEQVIEPLGVLGVGATLAQSQPRLPQPVDIAVVKPEDRVSCRSGNASMKPTRKPPATLTWLPPSAVWILLCGVFSRAPKPQAQVASQARGLPKPWLDGLGAELVKVNTARAAVPAADSVSWASPWFSAASHSRKTCLLPGLIGSHAVGQIQRVGRSSHLRFAEGLREFALGWGRSSSGRAGSVSDHPRPPRMRSK